MIVDPKALLGEALAARQAGRHEQAVELLERAVSQAPGNAELLFHLGGALRACGRLEAAVEPLLAARRLAPEVAAVAINLGGLLILLGRGAEAAPHLKSATELAPSESIAWGNYAAALLQTGEAADAAEAATRATRLKTENVEAWAILAQAALVLRDFKRARAAASEATRRAPSYRDGWIALANIESAAKDAVAAAAAFRRAAELDPEDPGILGSLLMHLQQIAAWEEAAAVARKLDALPFRDRDMPAEPLLVAVSRSMAGARHLEVAKAWGARIAKRMHYAAPERPSLPRKQRLRIGYLSYDFRDHAVGHLVSGLFTAHDRALVEVFGYSYGRDDRSQVRQEIAAGCDRFVDLAALGHREAARRIADDGIDILVDLTGQTKGNRLEIAALKPAPLICTWLGFPGTTGCAFVDYLIGDGVVTPPEEAAHYLEKLIILPRPYQANTHLRRIAPRPTRGEAGLPEDAFVFSSFNAPYKLEPAIFGAWMEILAAVEGALLWLIGSNAALEENLRRAAKERDVAPERLVFAPNLPHAEHLARLPVADLALDTRIYTGHTTTSDCLLMGLPVLTLEGRHFASRVSQSLLCSIGLEELVARDLEAYKKLGIQLARDPALLAALRARVAKAHEARLYDQRDMARALERAYQVIWERAANGAVPALIDLR